jgi:hypothetical protein
MGAPKAQRAVNNGDNYLVAMEASIRHDTIRACLKVGDLSTMQRLETGHSCACGVPE